MGFLNLIPKSALLVAIVLLTALLANATWDSMQDGKQLVILNGQIVDLKLDIAESKSNAAEAVLANTKKLLEAQNDAKLREKALQIKLTAAAATVDKLRLSTQEARTIFRLEGVAATPENRLADLGYDLLERCNEQYVKLAGRTEQYVGYVQELLQAWPTSQACTAKP